MLYVSGPPLFWHQGPVLWKTIFPQTRGVGAGVVGGDSLRDDPSALHSLCILFLLLHQFHLSSLGIRSWRLGTLALRESLQAPEGSLNRCAGWTSSGTDETLRHQEVQELTQGHIAGALELVDTSLVPSSTNTFLWLPMGPFLGRGGD